MTREEAIKYFKRHLDLYCVDGISREAEEMAIKALEQEPSGDLISRQALLDDLGMSEKTRKWGGDHSGYNTMMLYEIQDVIESQASVNPQEPKTGHWKRISIDKYSEHAKYWYRCDRCGRDNLGNTDWCPNCGCRMVEPQDKDIIWYDRRNYSEIVVEPQERSEKE